MFGFFVDLLLKNTAWYQDSVVDFRHERYRDPIWCQQHPSDCMDFVNLGSSSAKWAFDWEKIGVKGLNWANQPQTLIDDLRLFKQYHSVLNNSGKVLISIMPFSGLNKETGLLDTYKYCGIMDYSLMDSRYRDRAMRLFRHPSIWGKKNALRQIALHYLGREKKRPLPHGAMDDHNPMTEEKMVEDAQRMMDGWAKEFGINDFGEPLSEVNRQGREIRINVLKELIDFSTERGYEPVVVILPVAKQLANLFSEAFREKYIYSFLRSVGSDVRTLDYLQDETFQDPALYFNSFCLNKRGRETFTKNIHSIVR